jgi:hypothetical protein
LTFSVPNGEGEHASQVLDAIITVLLVGMNNDLCVTIRGKAVTALLEFFPKLTIVIDFPIEDDEDALIFVKDGLMATREVNNRETAHAQCSSIAYPHSLIVWPTVANNLAHAIYHFFCMVTAALYVNKSSYSAH